MTDVLTSTQRSRNMSRIRGKNTSPELVIRHGLYAKGLRYRLHQNLPGKPDLIFPRARLAVFVDGCFWHKCPKHFKAPSTRAQFWRRKIDANVVRDHTVNQLLRKQGWKVMRVWEHDVNRRQHVVISRITTKILSSI